MSTHGFAPFAYGIPVTIAGVIAWLFFPSTIRHYAEVLILPLVIFAFFYPTIKRRKK